MSVDLMSFYNFISNYDSIKEQYDFTIEKIKEIREAITESLKNSSYKSNICIVTTGSYGRNEASQSSDIDLFIIYEGIEENIRNDIDTISTVINKFVPKDAGSTGTFGSHVVIMPSDLWTNIGGQNDSNETMTRRMLLLLEGTWLYGEELFVIYKKKLLECYISHGDPASSASIARFLLNDIIRYYRTIATDFEFKVRDGRSWGLRNIKLRYSRKLIYFSGIISVASYVEKEQEYLLNIFTKTPLERIYFINPSSNLTHQLFEQYQKFLNILSDVSKRESLDDLDKSNRDNSEIYKKIRNESRDFSILLDKWIKETYHSNHPIHNALLF